MEGLTFYWVSWFFWIIATFFMNKNGRSRLMLSLFLLLLIIVSPYTVVLFNFELSIAGLLLCCPLYSFAARLDWKKRMYLLICSFIIMLAYVCFHLFALFDPVWLIFPRNWMLAVILMLLSFVLNGKKIHRMYIVVLGAIQGEFLYALILSKYSFPYVIGSLTFLDVLSLSTILIVLWSGMESLASFYERHFNQLEREKQKLS
ncbi:hypothetical protein ACFFHH_08385 [Cytobacillus solani]|uniref:Uncharacterized protein n=1 Tax=Cytobacillus solani TaxID=1637975 RepID=A0A0Q3QRI5_9BACI|nr:hypothetical protein [Cytobacillus solani]KOP83259.1 hypothetical protein AMS60_12685 [Bacillus sp. FJAT-21945]KQL20286.1 hypothetical protein AN957_17995 [Cytobacillus solani]USK53540.1 hypothetical protein LIS82_18285 [Cytobacillus solani]